MEKEPHGADYGEKQAIEDTFLHVSSLPLSLNDFQNKRDFNWKFVIL